MNKKILIVDDQPENLKTIIDIFSEEPEEYDVIQAPNGKVALMIIEKIPPDMIITDWEMPQMNGIEFIKHLKQKPETADIPIIMCTGVMTSSENLNTALEAGAIDYIRKPIDRIELIARTKANLHLADSYKRIKDLNKAKDRIFAVISHDLRGPVGNIKSFTDMILHNTSKYNQENFVDFITQIGEQNGATFTILENLLQWANAQSNNIIFHPHKLPINKAVTDNLILLKESAKVKNITLQNNIPNDINATFDTRLISTVIRNLVSNAIKFTPKGGTISLNVEKGNVFHTVIISDTGVGISPDRIDKIFDKTTYETTYGTDYEKGSGLGLKLCLEFVEMHKGKIWVESIVGEGSKFCFTLPVGAIKFENEK